MKKIAVLLLTLVITLVMVCSCGSNEKNTDDTAEPETTQTETTTVDPEYQATAQIDYSNPIVETENVSYRNIYESDGIAHDNSYVIPHLNIGLQSALAINDEIDQYYSDNYSIHFAMLDDLLNEQVHAGEKCLNITYKYAIDHDVVSIVIVCEQSYPPSDPTYTYKVFHWDALADRELTCVEYMEYNGISTNGVSSALAQKDIVLTEDNNGTQLSDIVYVEESDSYDLYLLNQDGSMSIVNVNLEQETAPSIPNS